MNGTYTCAMSELVLKDANSSTTLTFSGEIARGLVGYDGCNFAVVLDGRELSAKVVVYDIQPQRWSSYFADLAMSWRGWDGVKEKSSLEGHLELSASSDPLGHIRIRVVLRGIDASSAWRAETDLYLEAGQLDLVAKRAAQFFG
jgi:Family of unknown function (DUF6228)